MVSSGNMVLGFREMWFQLLAVSHGLGKSLSEPKCSHLQKWDKSSLLQRLWTGLKENSTHEGVRRLPITVRCSADKSFSLSLDKKHEIPDSYFWWEVGKKHKS